MAIYKCPKCEDDDHLYVTIKVDVRLMQDNDDNIQTDYEGGDHEWDGDSPMCCSACGWNGTVQDAAAKEQ